jgi:hypothetical protein
MVCDRCGKDYSYVRHLSFDNKLFRLCENCNNASREELHCLYRNIENREEVKRLFSIHIENWIYFKPKKIKRIFSDIDPYGEEDWGE